MRLSRLRVSTTRFTFIETMFFKFMCSIHCFHRYIATCCNSCIHIRGYNTCFHRYISACCYCCLTRTTNTALIDTSNRFTTVVATVPFNFAITSLILHAFINHITPRNNLCGACRISLCNCATFINNVFFSIHRDCIVAHNSALCITNFVICCNRSRVTFNKTIIIVNGITSKSHILIRYNATTIMHSINRKVNRLGLQISATFYSFCVWC